MSIQKIINVKISDLVLWSENPRAPMDTASTDFEIIKSAVEDSNTKWNLPQMLEEMGAYYDFSELPTIVEVDGKFIVFDGNRRISVLKFIQNKTLYQSFGGGLFLETEPRELRELTEIPCNLCDRETALTNIERKHINNGSWGTLERDYFLNTHRGQDKSLFQVLDEQTGLISNNRSLNQRFVKEEILTENKLKDLGFFFDKSNSTLVSNHTPEKVKDIFDKIKTLIETKTLHTRGANRGKLLETLTSTHPELAGDLKTFDSTKPTAAVAIETPQAVTPPVKKTPRTKSTRPILFGKTLSLTRSDTNNLYLDICQLFNFYQVKQVELTPSFPSLIRMTLRLIVESASTTTIDDYVNANFATAKTKLTQDQKTTLATHSISTAGNLITLLHIGAHNYSASSNIEQTIAMSIIIGEMLELTHPKT